MEWLHRVLIWKESDHESDHGMMDWADWQFIQIRFMEPQVEFRKKSTIISSKLMIQQQSNKPPAIP